MLYYFAWAAKFRWCLNSSPPWSVGLSTQNDAMDVARSAPQGAHYNADVIYWELQREQRAYDILSSTRFPFFIPYKADVIYLLP